MRDETMKTAFTALIGLLIGAVIGTLLQKHAPLEGRPPPDPAIGHACESARGPVAYVEAALARKEPGAVALAADLIVFGQPWMELCVPEDDRPEPLVAVERDPVKLQAAITRLREALDQRD